MSILIGHASIDENGRASGGQAGDQTGKEVCTRAWYAGDWNVVLRPKSASVAEKMAAACETLCKGNLVGYDQGQRNTLWDELERVGWDAAKLKTRCETDCSAFMAACARCAGISIPRVALGGGKYNAPITQTMRNAFTSTGAFEVLTDAKYLTSDKYLKRGDILLRESGHTAMALGNGAQVDIPAQGISVVVATKPAASVKEVKGKGVARYRDNSLAGKYACAAKSFLSVRDAAGAEKVELTRLMPGEVVDCWGYYDTADGAKWLYITFVQNGVRYIGFACSLYLRKKTG